MATCYAPHLEASQQLDRLASGAPGFSMRAGGSPKGVPINSATAQLSLSALRVAPKDAGVFGAWGLPVNIIYRSGLRRKVMVILRPASTSSELAELGLELPPLR